MTTPYSTPFVGTLRPYQEAAHQFQLAHPRSMLADYMGLGKTHPTIATLATALPALVVAPTYLLEQWATLLTALLPKATISVAQGTKTKRQQALTTPSDVYLVNVEMLRTYSMPKIHTLVVDEAHHLRGRESQQGRGARRVAMRADRVHFLTATPFYKADEDIWHLLHLLAPKRFSSYWNFIREWYGVNWEAPYAPHIYGIAKSKRQAFDAMLRPYMLMRDYKDVGKDLPPLVEHNHTIELPPPVRDTYDTLKKDWQLEGEPIESVGSVYYLLRQLTMCNRKIQVVKDIIEDVPKGESILVYVWYVESAHTLAAALKRSFKEELPTLLITGGTPPEKRARMLAEQKEKRYPSIIVATIESLNEGANLEHIHHVIFAEETYVQGKHIQALARAHRDQQSTHTQPVVVHTVRAHRTIDIRIPLIRESRGLAGNRELARALAAS